MGCCSAVPLETRVIPRLSDPPFFDQRGIPYDRVFDGRIDMGAQENQPISPLDGDFDNDGDYDCHDIDALTAAVAAGVFDLLFDIYPDGSLTSRIATRGWPKRAKSIWDLAKPISWATPHLMGLWMDSISFDGTTTSSLKFPPGARVILRWTGSSTA